MPDDTPKPVRFSATRPTQADMWSIKIELSQKIDCCSSGISNELTVESMDGGGGNYVVIKGRWAMDNEKEVNELAKFIKAFLEK